jgi:hypothetical protein
MVTGGCVDREGFVKAIQAKIKHRIENGHCEMSRLDIEQIGRKVQMSSNEAADYFMDIQGQVWEGRVIPHSDHPWTGVAFDPEWFWTQYGIRPL